METGTETLESTVSNPLADAKSFSEHKAIRAGKGTPTTEANSASSDGDAKTETSTQEKDETQKRDRTFNGRISELTTARDTEKARADKAEQELRDLRTRKPEGTEKKETVQAESDDPKPKLADFVKASKENETYDEVVERWEDAVNEWRQKKLAKETQKSEQTERQKAIGEKARKKVEAARAKYEDYDHVTAGDLEAGTGLILSRPMINYFLEEEDGVDVIYELGKQPEEYKRIKALPSDRQEAALGRFAAKVSKEEKRAPETKTAPIVSKAPAPASKVGTGGEEKKESAATASSMAEYKKRRAEELKGRS